MSSTAINKLIGDEDEFKIVCGKLRIRRKINKNSCNLKLSENGKNEFDKITWLRKVASLRDDIKISEYFKNSINVIKSCLNKYPNIQPKLICLGLGSFANCQVAFHQFAFVLELCDTFNIKDPHVYDPVFTENECNILEEFNCRLLDNLEGKYETNELTIVYLPHCPKELTNNFLWKNWSMESLKKCILICNSFQNIIENIPKRILQEEVKFIFEISKYIQEYPIENNYYFKDVFNDISVHVLLKDKLQNINETFWKLCIDKEKIQNTK